MTADPALLKRIRACPFARGGRVRVRYRANGTSLFARRSGEPLARLRLTGEGDDVVLLYPSHRGGCMFASHQDRAVLSFVLMSCQAFCYNAVFFTYALVLTKFYDIPAQQIGWFMLPFALGNLAGPLLLGRFFDTIGRKVMITATYGLSAC
jgi:hypothetical protein